MYNYKDEEVAEIIFQNFKLKSGTEDQIIGKIRDALTKKMGHSQVQARNLMQNNDFISDVLASYKSLGGKVSSPKPTVRNIPKKKS